MLLVQPIKQTIARIFSSDHFNWGRSFNPEQQSAMIPIRHMKFDFDPKEIDHHFYMNAE